MGLEQFDKYNPFMKLFGGGSGKQTSSTHKTYEYLLKHLTLEEVRGIVKKYIGDKSKVKYTDDNGIQKTRPADRNDYIRVVIAQVPMDAVLDMYPKLKKHVE